MNIVLWVLQAVLGLLSVSGGGYKIAKFDDLKKGLKSMKALPKGLWMLLGAIECVAGLGLFVPGLAFGAAAALALESVVISALYIAYRDMAPVAYTAVMAVIAAFIAYGRMGA